MHETGQGYHIRERVRVHFQKARTKVYSAIRISTDESGSFCVAYDKIRKGGETIRFLGEHICAQREDTEADIRIDTEVVIQEGQEIGVNVGG